MRTVVAFGILINCLFWSCTVEVIHPETEVAIQPFEDVDDMLLDSIQHAIKEVYGVQTKILEPIDIPEYTFINIKSPRYRADSLIRFLRDSVYPEIEGDYVLGIIDKDISTTKYSDFSAKEIKSPEYKYKDWGIYGLGFCPGVACIVSTHRLEKGTTKENFVSRLKKVSCHEVGHNFGLPHCPNKDCIMQDAAETITTIDNVSLYLCEDCKKKLGMK